MVRVRTSISVRLGLVGPHHANCEFDPGAPEHALDDGEEMLRVSGPSMVEDVTVAGWSGSSWPPGITGRPRMHSRRRWRR